MLFDDTLELVSPRLRLVPITREWDQDIYCNFTAEVTRYMYPKPPTVIDETWAFIDSMVRKRQAGTDLVFVILDKGSGEFLGCFGLHHLASPTPELGIWLKTAAHGRGFGREAAHAALLWAKAHFSFEAFLYPVEERNFPSRNIPESYGAEVITRQQVTNQAGLLHNILTYRLPAERIVE